MVSKKHIILTSENDVNEFLASRPNPDQEFKWICPECGKVNNEIHFSHETKCECKKYAFPRVGLPVKGGMMSLKDAIIGQRVKEIEHEVSEYKSEISGYEEEINVREEWIYTLQKELKSLMTALKE